MFVRVWEYDVADEAVSDFTAAYGADGDWARLFATAPGFVGTRLYRDFAARGRFLTVDQWVDESAWQAFVRTCRAAYDALDTRLQQLGGGGRLVVEGDA